MLALTMHTHPLLVHLCRDSSLYDIPHGLKTDPRRTAKETRTDIPTKNIKSPVRIPYLCSFAQMLS